MNVAPSLFFFMSVVMCSVMCQRKPRCWLTMRVAKTVKSVFLFLVNLFLKGLSVLLWKGSLRPLDYFNYSYPRGVWMGRGCLLGIVCTGGVLLCSIFFRVRLAARGLACSRLDRRLFGVPCERLRSFLLPGRGLTVLRRGLRECRRGWCSSWR